MSPENWQIIVVEDTYDDVELASTILAYHGVDVIIAHNGQECLDLLQTTHPTCIVTDLSMPVMDGWQMLSHIRDIYDSASMPVIATTAYDSVEVAQEALKAGFNAYFPKPLSPRHFVDSLKELL